MLRLRDIMATDVVAVPPELTIRDAMGSQRSACNAASARTRDNMGRERLGVSRIGV